MKLMIARTAGFCMGVRRAVEMTLEAVDSCQKPICTFGPLIHNPQVLNLLNQKGVSVIETVPPRGHGTVLLRAHGVPPSVQAALVNAGFRVVDATCPRVIKVQTIIRRHATEGYGTIIVGDRNHPEVIGLLGYAGALGCVVGSLGELAALPRFAKAIVVAQTTQNTAFYGEIKAWVGRHCPHYQVFDTICDSTEKRQTEVKQLAGAVDAVVVVGGHNSGNTNRLAEIARQAGKPTQHIETEDELDCQALTAARSIAVSAGASTPDWMIRRVIQVLADLGPEGDRPSPEFQDRPAQSAENG
jgi:4-hydroxy-3-methylbut-2-enyl diphosphate reductase